MPITPEDIRNPERKSGYNNVTYALDSERRIRPYQARYGRLPGRTGRYAWRGPRRATPLEAAQDYCDHVNGVKVKVVRLNKAGHKVERARPDAPLNPNRVEAYRLLAIARKEEAESHDSGYIYAITDGEYIKIGKSRQHPSRRLRELQTGNARMLSLYGYMEVDDMATAETMYHRKFISLNVLGEWFYHDPVILSEFEMEEHGK